MSFKKIKKDTTPLIIVNEIINSIERGELKLNEKLPPERDLAKTFGVGRTSIREAIRALVVMGYLEVIQGKGTFVCRNSRLSDYEELNLKHIIEASSVFDLMEARKILEIGAIKLAAERIDAKQLTKMQKIISEMEVCDNNMRVFYEADLKFHNAIAEASSNAFIGRMMKILIKELHKHSQDFLATSYETKEKTIESAKMILELLSKGNGEEAALCMEYHLNEVYSSLKNVILEQKKGEIV